MILSSHKPLHFFTITCVVSRWHTWLTSVLCDLTVGRRWPSYLPVCSLTFQPNPAQNCPVDWGKLHADYQKCCEPPNVSPPRSLYTSCSDSVLTIISLFLLYQKSEWKTKHTFKLNVTHYRDTFTSPTHLVRKLKDNHK